MYTRTTKITSKVKLYPLFLPKFRTLTTFKQNEDVVNCIKSQQTICSFCNKYIFNCYCGSNVNDELIQVSEDFEYWTQTHSQTIIEKKTHYIYSLCNKNVCSCDDVKYEHLSQLEKEEYLYNRKEYIKEY